MSQYKLKTPKQGEAVVGAYKKIEETVVGAYKKVEDAVVGGYKKVEDTAVEGYKTVEKKFMDVFLETSEDDEAGCKASSIAEE